MGSQSEIMFHEILGCTTDAHWLNNVFLFSTEIWAEQLKKPPWKSRICIVYFVLFILLFFSGSHPQLFEVMGTFVEFLILDKQPARNSEDTNDNVLESLYEEILRILLVTQKKLMKVFLM